MRKKIVAGNWKMNTTAEGALELAKGVAQGVGQDDSVTVVLCPPYPYLETVKKAIEGSKVLLGAQNCYHEKEGAYTGEVSPLMLTNVGCDFVILGHSERRHVIGKYEDDEFINKKVHAALDAGLTVIVCVGETIQEREAGNTDKVLAAQFEGSLKGVDQSQLSQVVLAYEPVWAIGTGHNATPEQAQEQHVFLRGKLKEMFDEAAAQSVPIQYGGSMKPENALSLISQPDVDGGLIGGASLEASKFLAIIDAAKQS